MTEIELKNKLEAHDIIAADIIANCHRKYEPKFLDQLILEYDALQTKLDKAVSALERLARLGNGSEYGNSDGNIIAQQTLLEIKETK